MKVVPLWLRAVAAVTVLSMLVALAKPPVAPFILRGLVVAAALALIGATIAAILRDVVPADGSGRRPDPREPGDVPRDLDRLTDELRTLGRRDPLPPATRRALRAAFQHRLWHRRGLSTTMTEHHDAIQATVSPRRGCC